MFLQHLLKKPPTVLTVLTSMERYASSEITEDNLLSKNSAGRSCQKSTRLQTVKSTVWILDNIYSHIQLTQRTDASSRHKLCFIKKKNHSDRANCLPEKETLNIIVLFRAKREGFLRFILHFSNTRIYFSVSTTIEIPKANGTISVRTVFHSLKNKKYTYSGISFSNSKQRNTLSKNTLIFLF